MTMQAKYTKASAKASGVRYLVCLVVAAICADLSSPARASAAPASPSRPADSSAANATHRDPNIERHHQLKLHPPGRNLSERLLFLSEHGLSTDTLRATCGVYVRQRWSPVEQQDMARSGIEVNPDVWVPAVPQNRHPYGFHLVKVPYVLLSVLELDPNVVQIRSAETASRPANNTGATAIKADLVHAGSGIAKRTGGGVRVCIADSSLDLTLTDLPIPVEAYDVTTGSTVAQWSTDVHTTVSPHGTHVVGSVLGRGTSTPRPAPTTMPAPPATRARLARAGRAGRPCAATAIRAPANRAMRSRVA
jgi:hypothetical protein